MVTFHSYVSLPEGSGYWWTSSGHLVDCKATVWAYVQTNPCGVLLDEAVHQQPKKTSKTGPTSGSKFG